MTLAIAWFCSKVSDDDIIVISFFSFARSLKSLRVGGLPWHSSASSAGCRSRRLPSLLSCRSSLKLEIELQFEQRTSSESEATLKTIYTSWRLIAIEGFYSPRKINVQSFPTSSAV